MVFLFDAISASHTFTHYKIYEVDTDVYYAYTTTKWKDGTPPNDFYVSKVNWQWQTNTRVIECVLEDITTQLDQFIRNRKLEAAGSAKPGWLY